MVFFLFADLFIKSMSFQAKQSNNNPIIAISDECLR